MKDVAIPQPQMPKQLQHLNEVRAAERETRCAEAWALRLKGFSVREISEQLNISVGTASKYLRTVLEELQATSIEGAETWRRLELDRLDALLRAWQPIARAPSDPEAARGAAIVIRAIEAQSRLLGLFEPAGAEAQPQNSEAEKEPEVAYEEQLARSPALRSRLKKQLENAEKGAQQPIPVPA
jgi:hypothetical protein